LTIIDRSTRWVEAVPLRATWRPARPRTPSSQTGWHVLVCRPQSQRTGVPQFTSALWTGAYTGLGIKHVLTTSYHPQCNGISEHVHRQIKDALRARDVGSAWHSHLPWVLMGMRAAPKENSAVSSAELVYGSPLILPGQQLHMPDAPHVECHRRTHGQPPTRQSPTRRRHI
jgi:hypothetical protein